MSVGMPYCLLLQEFGEHVFRAFGSIAYHVGSSLANKDGWRDVDVRLMLPDEEYERMGLGDPDRSHENKRWVSLVLAWSSFGSTLTGLPIDFQIQQQSHANKNFTSSRSALFTVCDTRPQPSNSDEDAAAPDLLAALRSVMGLIEAGDLVRNIADDMKPGFGMRQMPLVMALKSAQDAIEKAEGRE